MACVRPVDGIDQPGHGDVGHRIAQSVEPLTEHLLGAVALTVPVDGAVEVRYRLEGVQNRRSLGGEVGIAQGGNAHHQRWVGHPAALVDQRPEAVVPRRAEMDVVVSDGDPGSPPHAGMPHER